MQTCASRPPSSSSPRLKAETADVFASRPLGLTFEIVEIDPVGSLKHNNLHDIVAARRKA